MMAGQGDRQQPAAAPGGRIGLGPAVVVGLVTIVLFFGGLGSWAALAPLESAAIAPGVVSVASSRKTVQHLEGGIIGAILVRDGDAVSAGQLLIRLDETLPRATLDLLLGRQRSSAAMAARLIAERDGLDHVVFPGWLLDDTAAADVIAGEIGIFEARAKTLASQIAVLGQRVAQFEEEIAGLKGQIVAQDTQLRLIAEELASIGKLVELGLERKPRLLALQRRAAEIEGERSENRALIARARQSIGEARLRMTELETQRINEVVEQLRETESLLFDLAERSRAAKDVLKRTEIRALQDGTVVGLRVHTPGGVIRPGAPLLDIVPRDDRLIIEARVAPDDIDVVRIGLEAKVRLTAFNQRSLVPINGRVIAVSADRLTDERSGEAYFLARIELIEDPAEVLAGAVLYPGMQAEVMIVTGARTALDYFLTPITRSLDRALRED